MATDSQTGSNQPAAERWELKDAGQHPFGTLSAHMLYQLLGPTAEYLGDRLRLYTERAVPNVERVFTAAYKHLGDRIKQPGDVPPRVLRGTIQEGAFCEDEIAAEYLGGVLASSRGEGNRDDRGVVMNALIARLSVYQLRTHYLVYHAVRDLYEGTAADELFRYTGVVFPAFAYMAAMGFHEHEAKDPLRLAAINSIIDHTFFGLRKEELIDNFELFADGKDAISVIPSWHGAELFLWAHGYGDASPPAIIRPDIHIQPPVLPYTGGERCPVMDVAEGKVIEFIEPYDYYVQRSGIICRLARAVAGDEGDEGGR